MEERRLRKGRPGPWIGGLARGIAAAVTGLALTALPAGGLGATPAAASGGWTASTAAAGDADTLSPARDRYEPGQIVTMIGYSGGDPQAWRTTAYYGWLQASAEIEQGSGGPGLRVGRVTVEEVTPFWKGDLRVSIEFSLPRDLAPGLYFLDICDEACARRLGFFVPSTVSVGVDPAEPVVRGWPLTDPAIRWLEADALLDGPTGPVTAADVRAGRVLAEPTPTAQGPPPAPVPAPEAPATRQRPSSPPPAVAGQRDPAGRGAADETADVVTADAERSGGPLLPWLVAAGVVLAGGGAALRWRSGRRYGGEGDRHGGIDHGGDEGDGLPGDDDGAATGDLVVLSDRAGVGLPAPGDAAAARGHRSRVRL